jgi:hypothetical protein
MGKMGKIKSESGRNNQVLNPIIQSSLDRASDGPLYSVRYDVF